ncbi:MAG: hypothetical protein ACOCX0_07120 [Bacteroidota bacterium]
MKKFRKFNSLLLIIVSLVLAPLAGCEKDDEGTPPQLPPPSSFNIDFSDFTEETKSQYANDTYIHRGYALLNVAVWNTIIQLHLAIPVAAFNEAFNHTPVPQADGSWLWSYDVEVGINTFTANLYAMNNGNTVEWSMYISKTGQNPYTDFLWFSGISHLDRTQGEWTLYKSPNENIPYVGIEWFTNGDENAEITYTNIVPDGPENGGYIKYGRTAEVPYNAFYDIFNKGEDNLTEIEWDTITKAGRIKDPKAFGNDAFYCWDSTGADTECP